MTGPKSKPNSQSGWGHFVLSESKAAFILYWRPLVVIAAGLKEWAERPKWSEATTSEQRDYAGPQTLRSNAFTSIAACLAVVMSGFAFLTAYDSLRLRKDNQSLESLLTYQILEEKVELLKARSLQSAEAEENLIQALSEASDFFEREIKPARLHYEKTGNTKMVSAIDDLIMRNVSLQTPKATPPNPL